MCNMRKERSVIAKKYRDEAMRKIIEYYSQNSASSHFITKRFLELQDEFNGVDCEQLLLYLEAKGLVEYRHEYGPSEKTIRLTKQGRCYFEDQQEIDERRTKQFKHDWKIAIFSAIAGALASEPLWAVLHKLIDIIAPK